MRIRSILPDFYRSEDVAAMDWHTRLVFIGLWSYVDDNGVGRDNAKLIASDLFPLDGDSTETLRRVSTALEWLSEHGQIKKYRVDEQAYLYVQQWDRYQRVQNPGKQRYPRPTSDSVDPAESLRRVSVDPPETLSPGEGEKGRRGEGKRTPPAAAAAVPYTPEFEEFWQHYPRKHEKADAFKAWKTAIKRADPDTLIRAVRAYRFTDNPKFIKLGATWLNKRAWEDVPAAAPTPPGSAPRPMYDVSKVPPHGQLWTKDDADRVLGPDTWTPPEPTADLDPPTRERWEWEQRRKHEQIRLRDAQQLTGWRFEA